MWLGEEAHRVALEDEVLVGEVRDAHGHHILARHTRLLRVDALLPRPHEALHLRPVEDTEGEVLVVFRCAGEGERDAPYVVLGRHARQYATAWRNEPVSRRLFR